MDILLLRGIHYCGGTAISYPGVSKETCVKPSEMVVCRRNNQEKFLEEYP
jgi:hypothetical protein